MTSRTKKQSSVERLIGKFDGFQQRQKFLAMPYAVIKKYSDDDASYHAALMAYYGFMSLFPLLIVGTTVVRIVTQNNLQMREDFLRNATSYFPAIGDNLASSIHTPAKTGVALLLALVIAFYGARGVASAVQHSLNHIWSVPRARRPGFPHGLLRSLGIICYAGTGFILAAALTGYAAATTHALWARLVLGTTGFVVLFFVFWGVYVFGSAARKHPLASASGAVFAAVGFVILQALGGYIIAHQLKTQTGLTAQFAVVLAILFWLYLQAQVFLLGAELASVRSYKLWPRSINPSPPLLADQKAYDLYHKRETFVDNHPIGH